MKYTTIKIGEVITQVALTTEIPGYTVGILETFIPDDNELENWTEEQSKDWIIQNNKRMEAICKFLNENNL